MNYDQLLAMIRVQTDGTEVPDDAAEAEAKLCLDRYARLSVNPLGVKDSVPRQIRQLDRLAPTLPYRIGQTFKDDGKSAYDETKPRPEFERLFSRMERGESDGVLCVALDRLLRNLTDMARLVQLGQKAARDGRRLYVVTPYGSSDLANNEHIAMLYFQAISAWKQSADTSRRLRAAVTDKYEAGKPFPFGKRSFGFEADHETLRFDEANEIRAMAKEFKQGAKWSHIAADLNRRGIRTATGAQWSSGTVRQMVLRPSNAGILHTRNNKFNGRRLDLKENILDMETYEDLVTLAGMKNKPYAQEMRGKYLLSGLLICGTCGTKMHGRTRKSTCPSVFYTCSNRIQGACSAVTINAPKTDDVVRYYVISELAKPEYTQRIGAALANKNVERSALFTERATLEGMLDELADNLDIPPDVLARRSRAVKAKLVDVATKLDSIDTLALERGADTLKELVGQEIAAAWDGTTEDDDAAELMSRRQTMIRAVVLHFKILPGSRGKWRPERIIPVGLDGAERRAD